MPQWTSRLEAYEVLGDGALGRGTQIRQVLTVSGQQARRRAGDHALRPAAAPPRAASRTSGARRRDRPTRCANGGGTRADADARRQGVVVQGADARPDGPAAPRGQAHGGPRAAARAALLVELRPPLSPRVPDALEPLEPATIEDEGRFEALELAGDGELAVRHLTLTECRVRGTLGHRACPTCTCPTRSSRAPTSPTCTRRRPRCAGRRSARPSSRARR